jgi:hypothetical protein
MLMEETRMAMIIAIVGTLSLGEEAVSVAVYTYYNEISDLVSCLARSKGGGGLHCRCNELPHSLSSRLA